MNMNELIGVAAAIAGPLSTRAFETGGVSPDKIQELARTAVQIAKEIEKEARRSYTPS
jgi:hypothetical protein